MPTNRDCDAPDPEGLDFDELLGAYHRMLRTTCGASVSWHSRYGYGAKALEGEIEVDVWTPPSALVEIKRYLEGQLDVSLEFETTHQDLRQQLVAVCNALDADVERALEGGIREEIEEVYLGLRALQESG